jgi:hypothetical protein
MGKPTVVVTTPMFERLTHTVVDSFGLPDARILVVPHPLGGTDHDTILSWADAAVEQAGLLLTARAR